MEISLLKMSKAGVTFVDFPMELQLKIFSQLNLAQILTMLRIHPWKEAILDYLTIEARRARKNPSFYPLLDKFRYDKKFVEFFNYNYDELARQNPNLATWTNREPVAWFLSAHQLLKEASVFNQKKCSVHLLDAASPMHNPVLNTNVVCYTRNKKLCIWRRQNQQMHYIDCSETPVENIWTCKSNIELHASEKFIVYAAIADTGHVQIRFYCTINFTLLWSIQSSRSYDYKTLRIVSVDDNGRILLSVQRTDESDIEEEVAADFEDLDKTEATYLFAGPRAEDVTEIETIVSTENVSTKVYLFGNTFYKLTLEKCARYFGSAVNIKCAKSKFGKKGADADEEEVFKQRTLFTIPDDVGLAYLGGEICFWYHDRLEFRISSVEDLSTVVTPVDLRCKTDVNVLVNGETITLTGFDHIHAQTFVLKFFRKDESSVVAFKRAFLKQPVSPHSVHTSDSAIAVLHPSRVYLEVYDYLSPLL